MEKILDMFPRLRERVRQPGGTLSGGEQQMLAVGRAMMSEPRLICLDEPSLGLAPMVVQDIFRTIKAINAAGTSVLLVEQNARHALGPAQRCATTIVFARPTSAAARPNACESDQSMIPKSGFRFSEKIMLHQ
jgi:ABC-type branched-subunit amino acid transport system ATPase component